jgi:phenylacetate-CoA ligase
VYDWYGVADTGIIAAEGPDRKGLYVWEDAHCLEILDADTHVRRPDGELGNMCVTVLFKDGVYPIVRFDTNDVSSFLPRASDDRLTFRRISGFRGRSDHMIKLRGVNVYPTAIGAHVSEHAALTGEFVCRAERHGGRDELIVVVEVRPGADRSDLGPELTRLFRQKLGVEVGVELVGPGATAPLTEIDARQKPIRLIDRRHPSRAR